MKIILFLFIYAVCTGECRGISYTVPSLNHIHVA